mgnify:CR=1 FL=1
MMYAIPGQTPAAAAAAPEPQATAQAARSVAQVLADSKVLAVLDELDRDLVGLAPVKARIRDIAGVDHIGFGQKPGAVENAGEARQQPEHERKRSPRKPPCPEENTRRHRDDGSRDNAPGSHDRHREILHQ